MAYLRYLDTSFCMIKKYLNFMDKKARRDILIFILLKHTNDEEKGEIIEHLLRTYRFQKRLHSTTPRQETQSTSHALL